MEIRALERINSASHTQVMGIFNATPDSFFDGGRYADEAAIQARMREMVLEGADILDLGAESSRPGARPVTVEEELQRLAAPLAAAMDVGAPVSVDTCKSEVARYALERGALMINDITALRHDERMADVVAGHECLCVLMHMQGTPGTMQKAPAYKDVVGEVYDFLARRVEFALSRGIPESRIWIDPGFGFGKTLEQNLELMRRLEEFLKLGRPVLMGTSNKSMVGHVLDLPPDERVEGTAATVALGISKGVHCIRVHAVKPMKRVATMCDAILGRIPACER